MSKICITCQVEIDRPRANECKKCVKKRISDRYCEKNREHLREASRIFRENNRKLAQHRSKICRLKKLEHYKLKTRQRYRVVHGQPIDKPMTKRAAGEGNIDAQGYKTITKRGHPNQMDAKGRIREHVYIMSNHLGRPLFKGETIHHKNGDRLDNRIENLELWNRGQPPGQRIEDRIKYYIEFLEQYGYKVIK
jgi:hypothetical protein